MKGVPLKTAVWRMKRLTNAHRSRCEWQQLNASEEHSSVVTSVISRVMRIHIGHILIHFAVDTDAIWRFNTQHNSTSYLLSHTTPTLNTTLAFIHACNQSHKLKGRSAHIFQKSRGLHQTCSRPKPGKLHTEGQPWEISGQGVPAPGVGAPPLRRHVCVSRGALSDGLRISIRLHGIVLQCAYVDMLCHVGSCYKT